MLLLLLLVVGALTLLLLVAKRTRRCASRNAFVLPGTQLVLGHFRLVGLLRDLARQLLAPKRNQQK